MKQRVPWVPFVLSVLFCVSAAALAASVPEELRVKREAVFEFAQNPAVTRNGDNITIAFETRGFCDATVAIEDAKGNIIRHLASGVLGPKAPAPFQPSTGGSASGGKNGKKQKIVWDGKPLVIDGGPPGPRSIGGDEVGLIYACYVSTHTDRRLFIADAGNARILSVKLGYHHDEKIALKDVADPAGK